MVVVCVARQHDDRRRVGHLHRGRDRVRLAVILRARDVADQYLLKHEFLKRLDARYPAEGIALARYFATPNVNTVLDR